MSSLTNMVKKEFKELLTKSTIIPVILMALLFGYMGSMMGDIEEEVTAKPMVGVVDLDDGVMSDMACHVLNASATLVYNGTDIESGLGEVKETGAVALIVLPANFSSNILSGSEGYVEVYWVMEGAGMLDSISSASVDALLNSVSYEIALYLVSESGIEDPALVFSPTERLDTTIFKDKEMEGISPDFIISVLSAQSFTVPFIIMMIIIMAGGMVISSMGLEKENKTLETLLTLPVSRRSIVAGKLVASALVGLVMATIYMVGFNYYMTSLEMSADIDLAQYGLDLSSMDYLLVGVSVFVSLLAALSMCMVLGTYAKNYKSAQTLTMPITLLVIIPMFITMFKDFGTLPPVLQAVLFAIPFSHPMMAMRELMFDNYALVLGGIAYVTVFALVMVAVTVWIFNTDRLLTCSTKKRALGDLRSLLAGRLRPRD
ncbi:MAG: ABC transporter permease [Thermoplasmata archaeon]